MTKITLTFDASIARNVDDGLVFAIAQAAQAHVINQDNADAPASDDNDWFGQMFQPPVAERQALAAQSNAVGLALCRLRRSMPGAPGHVSFAAVDWGSAIQAERDRRAENERRASASQAEA